MLDVDKNAPVAIFCYRRPAHLLNTLNHLINCMGFHSSPIFVFCDGPKDVAEQKLVNETIAVAKRLLPSRTEFHISIKNKGLSSSIASGVSYVLEKYPSIIVVEDDLVLDPLFLNYMNSALNFYRNSKSIYQVSGYIFAELEKKISNQTFSAPYITSWGWATWADRWELFNIDCPGWEKLLGNRFDRRRFDAGGSYDYSGMLYSQRHGLVDSWAIAWYYAVFLEQGHAIFPPYSLVKNNGFDGSGSNGSGLLSSFGRNTSESVKALPTLLPAEKALDLKKIKMYEKALYKAGGGLLRAVLSIGKRLIRE
ncbi:hypothetical protein N8933_07710 [Pseudomonadales bacterium]|nr:hypothetical protein [Pseudomonadales bacterium]